MTPSQIGNDALPTDPGTRVLDGFFQALAVRCGGFYVVAISALRPGLLVLYVLMMYISAYPCVFPLNIILYLRRGTHHFPG